MCTLRMNGWSMAVTTVRPWRPGSPSWIDRWTKWKRSSPRPTVRRQTNRSSTGGSFSSSARRCSATMGETNGILHSIDSRSSSVVLCKCCICNYRIVISGIDKVLLCWIECYIGANEWFIALYILDPRDCSTVLWKSFQIFFYRNKSTQYVVRHMIEISWWHFILVDWMLIFFSNVRTTAMIHFDIPQPEVQCLIRIYVNYRYLVASIHSDFYKKLLSCVIIVYLLFKYYYHCVN